MYFIGFIYAYADGAARSEDTAKKHKKAAEVRLFSPASAAVLSASFMEQNDIRPRAP